MKAAEKQIYRKTKQMHPVYNELHKMEKGKEELLEKLKECEDEKNQVTEGASLYIERVSEE